MIRSGRDMLVNEPGETIVLNRHQVWLGLEMKAMNAVPFVPSITECKVVEEWEGGLLREIVNAGERLQEAITKLPERIIHFRRISELTPGDIFNELYFNDDGQLTLTFTFALDLPGITAGTEEAKQFSDELEDAYIKALQTTIEHIRMLPQKGEI